MHDRPVGVGLGRVTKHLRSCKPVDVECGGGDIKCGCVTLAVMWERLYFEDLRRVVKQENAERVASRGEKIRQVQLNTVDLPIRFRDVFTKIRAASSLTHLLVKYPKNVWVDR
jgi:hypothetical protein